MLFAWALAHRKLQSLIPATQQIFPAWPAAGIELRNLPKRRPDASRLFENQPKVMLSSNIGSRRPLGGLRGAQEARRALEDEAREGLFDLFENNQGSRKGTGNSKTRLRSGAKR